MPWNPDSYAQFPQRAAPFYDLLDVIGVKAGARIVDLGCGDGKLTAELADRLSASEVIGVDQSSSMLAEARKHQQAAVRFVQAELSGWVREASTQQTFDLVFSNSALQWVPDHEALFPRILSLAAPGGQVALQFPTNFDHIAQVLLGDISNEEPFAQHTGGYVRPQYELRIDRYADLLFKVGYRSIVAVEKVYCHELADASELVKWLQGTGMIPYLERIPATLHEQFVTRYGTLLRQQMPGSPILYGQKRIIVAGKRI